MRLPSVCEHKRTVPVCSRDSLFFIILLHSPL